MFIDVTRHGGVVLLRLAVTAIAYLTDTSNGCAIHLVGGETIRANEGRDEIEARIVALTAPSIAQSITLDQPDAVFIIPPSEPLIESTQAALQPCTVAARRQHPQRGRNKR